MSRSRFSNIDSSKAGSLMTYFSLDQLPRSNRRQRSLQKGKSGDVAKSTGLRQMGQERFIRRAYRKGVRG